MIPVLLLAGAAALIGAVVYKFWDEIVQFAVKVYNHLPERIRKKIQGFVSTIQKIGKKLLNVIKNYAYDPVEDQWTEHTTEKIVNANDVPEHIRNKVQKSEEVDISEDVKEKLELVA